MQVEAVGPHNGNRREELHPMKNDTILTKLFEFCPPSTLANCRLVCKNWNQLSAKSWRSSFFLNFRHQENADNKDEIYLAHRGDNDGHKNTKTSLLEFLAFWEKNCQTQPFRHFRIEKLDVPFAGTEFGMKNALFLEMVGEHITKLELVGCFFVDPGSFRRIILRSFPNLQDLALTLSTFIFGLHAEMDRKWKVGRKTSSPNSKEELNANLRSLSIEFVKHDQRYFGLLIRFPVTWTELFSYYPGMTTFSLSVPEKTMPISEYVKVLEAVQTIKKSRGGEGGSFLKRINFGHTFPVNDEKECVKMFELAGQLKIELQLIPKEAGYNLKQRIQRVKTGELPMEVENYNFRTKNR